MNTNDFKNNQTIRTILVVSIIVILAAIHGFRAGSYLKGDMYIYYYSYASYLMLPFVSCFLLSINEIRLIFLRKWYVKVLIVFSIMTFSEVVQFFGVYIFGVTFDLIDILMYGTGAFVAAFLDTQIFEKYYTVLEILSKQIK